MRLLQSTVNNFGSYSELYFRFDDKGLTLISGPTGSGKSTLQDIATWILFGVTAKDGNADEIRNWTNLEATTEGTILVELPDVILSICRIRGKSSENDLFWIEYKNPMVITKVNKKQRTVILDIPSSHEEHRGKDIIETQRLLEQRLGVSKELYMAGAYYNEFSPTGTFFTAKAKDRRELFENLANLDLPVKLAERIVNVKREVKTSLVKAVEGLNKTRGRLEQLKKTEANLKRDAEGWSQTQKRVIEEFEEKSKNWEEAKNKKLEEEFICLTKEIENLSFDKKEIEDKIKNIYPGECPTCGNQNEDLPYLKIRLKTCEAYIKSIYKRYEEAKVSILSGENSFKVMLDAEIKRVNPLSQAADSMIEDIKNAENLAIELEAITDQCEHKLGSLIHLNELSLDLRAALLKKVTKEIESSTNKYLEAYFDSEIQVQFDLDADNLTVSMFKNSHPCVFTQLSKGQRCLLKLCFSVSVMKAAANKAGVHFANLFFDEALDGLDADLKVKAFGLFSELQLEHESVFVIEHSQELQNLFDRKYRISMIDDQSVVEEV